MRAITLLLFLICSTAAAATEYVRTGAAEFNRSDRYITESATVGDRFRVDVLLPLGYDPQNTKYPVIYVTDANYLLSSVAATYLAQAYAEYPKSIIVGIGWDVPSITRIRVRDLTPTCDAAYQQQSKLTDSECGQADKFISYINNELRPFIDAQYSTNGDSTLVGYSFGGLFALHVLFNHTDTFDRYVIGSASMNWDDQFVFSSEARYAKSHSDLAKVVYLSAGELELDGTLSNAFRLYETLLQRDYPGLRIKMEFIADETHMTSISSMSMRGLGFVLNTENKRAGNKSAGNESAGNESAGKEIADPRN
ncbi:MAG: alpha/beta hydrolase-fold protein [Pseudomonadota bacterium]